MQSDYEIEAHVSYRIEAARAMRKDISTLDALREENQPAERRAQWPRRLPRFVQRLA